MSRGASEASGAAFASLDLPARGDEGLDGDGLQTRRNFRLESRSPRRSAARDKPKFAAVLLLKGFVAEDERVADHSTSAAGDRARRGADGATYGSSRTTSSPSGRRRLSRATMLTARDAALRAKRSRLVARADEVRRLEQGEEARLGAGGMEHILRQIAACTIRARSPGFRRLRVERGPRELRGRRQAHQQGATVREGARRSSRSGPEDARRAGPAS